MFLFAQPSIRTKTTKKIKRGREEKTEKEIKSRETTKNKRQKRDEIRKSKELNDEVNSHFFTIITNVGVLNG